MTVVEKNQSHAVAEVHGSESVMAIIDRASRDPNVDIDKLERLMGMHERLQARQAEQQFSESLAEMQEDLPVISERGHAAGRYTYALWEDINAAIKPVLKRHGFALSFRTDCTDGVSVTGVLSHRGGHSVETTIKLPSDASGNKNAVQAVASSVSYGKRYTAGALLNLTSHGEDDDAYAAGDKSAPVTEEEEAEIRTRLEQLDEETQTKFLKWAKVRNVSQIVRGAYATVIETLDKKIAKQKEADNAE